MKESNEPERFPRLFQFQKSGLFQNRGNFNLAGFQGKMKLPIFGKISRLNREFHPEILPIFGIPEFKSTLKPREFQVEGVSLLSLKLSVLKELSHFGGELQSEKSPRLSNSKNLDYFKIAGILIWRGFRVK